MKISDVIKGLTDAQDELGDIELMHRDPGCGCCSDGLLTTHEVVIGDDGEMEFWG